MGTKPKNTYEETGAGSSSISPSLEEVEMYEPTALDDATATVVAHLRLALNAPQEERAHRIHDALDHLAEITEQLRAVELGYTSDPIWAMRAIPKA